MVKFIILLLSTFTLSICHAKEIIDVDILYTPIRQVHVAEHAERYVRDFEKLYKITIDVPIYFESNLDGDEVGQHWRFGDGYREIVIEEEWWERATILQRRALIFHELGHNYGQEHRDKVSSNGCHMSLMHKNMASQKCLRKYWHYYEKEFLKHKRK